MSDLQDADILLNGRPVATALNGSFVARERRGELKLSRGDRINLFKAIVGG
jgi:thiamine biosynthesis protein ThiS